MNQKYVRWSLLLFLILLLVALQFFDMTDLLTLENLNANQILLKSYIHENYLSAVLIFTILYMVTAALAIPTGLILSISGGYFFGAVRGTIFINIGATLGAVLALLLSRYLIGDWIQDKYKESLARFNDEIDGNGISYMLSIRLVPAFPFFLINLLAGLTRLPLKHFIWTTSIGIIPGSFVYAYAGANLANLHSPSQILSTPIIAALTLMGMLALLPTLIKKIKEKPI